MKFTAPQAAKKLGVAESTLRRYVRQCGVGEKLMRDWLLSDADLETLRAAGLGVKIRGNPDWIAAGQAKEADGTPSRKRRKPAKKRRSDR